MTRTLPEPSETSTDVSTTYDNDLHEKLLWAGSFSTVLIPSLARRRMPSALSPCVTRSAKGAVGDDLV